MADLAALEQATEAFFDRYWPTGCSSSARPPWQEWIQFHQGPAFQGPVPNHLSKGCYALFAGQKLIYIGIGAGVSHGISKRLTGHVICGHETLGRNHYQLTSKWSEVSSIHTIGFPEEDFYLAAALEVFLIEKLDPLRNGK